MHNFKEAELFNKLAKPFSCSTAFEEKEKSLNLSVGSHAYTKGSKEFQRPISGKTAGEAKGQLISKLPFGVFKLTKKAMKFL